MTRSGWAPSRRAQLRPVSPAIERRAHRYHQAQPVQSFRLEKRWKSAERSWSPANRHSSSVDEVPAVGHQAITQHPTPRPGVRLSQDSLEWLVIARLVKDCHTACAPIEHVVNDPTRLCPPPWRTPFVPRTTKTTTNDSLPCILMGSGPLLGVVDWLYTSITKRFDGREEAISVPWPR